MAQGGAFPRSSFTPVAIGFFGLGTGYLIWGGQALFGFPKRSEEVDQATGHWGRTMPGVLQIITGLTILLGLTVFPVFAYEPTEYMAALAFTAFGVHWLSLGRARMMGAATTPDAWMAIGFLLLSILGAIVFGDAGNYPVMILFIGLALIYASEIPTRFEVWPAGHRVVGFWQVVTGVWLMYLTYAEVAELALGRDWFFLPTGG